MDFFTDVHENVDGYRHSATVDYIDPRLNSYDLYICQRCIRCSVQSYHPDSKCIFLIHAVQFFIQEIKRSQKVPEATLEAESSWNLTKKHVIHFYFNPSATYDIYPLPIIISVEKMTYIPFSSPTSTSIPNINFLSDDVQKAVISRFHQQTETCFKISEHILYRACILLRLFYPATQICT